MATTVNFTFDNDEDFSFPFQATDGDGNAINLSGSQWVLTVRAPGNTGTPTLQLVYGLINISIGSPTQLSGLSFVSGQPLEFYVGPGGTLPTNLFSSAAEAVYYVLGTSYVSPFEISTSPGGSPLNTSGSLVGNLFVLAGIDGTDQANGNVTITFPKSLLPVGTYAYDFERLYGSFENKILKGTINVTQGVL